MSAALVGSAIQSVANFASLPAPISGIWLFRVTADTQKLYFSNGTSWIDLTAQILAQVPDPNYNMDGGKADTNYTSTLTVDGGNA